MERRDQQQQERLEISRGAERKPLDEWVRMHLAFQGPFKFIKLRDDAVIPKGAHMTDVGADLVIIREDQRVSDVVWRYGTGLKVADIPIGYYLEIHARSSLPRYGLCLANSVGIIDQGYRGEILVQLHKIDPSAPWPTLPFSAAQLIVRKHGPSVFLEVNEEDATVTDRGEGGFGSTRADQEGI